MDTVFSRKHTNTDSWYSSVTFSATIHSGGSQSLHVFAKNSRICNYHAYIKPLTEHSQSPVSVLKHGVSFILFSHLLLLKHEGHPSSDFPKLHFQVKAEENSIFFKNDSPNVTNARVIITAVITRVPLLFWTGKRGPKFNCLYSPKCPWAKHLKLYLLNKYSPVYLKHRLWFICSDKLSQWYKQGRELSSSFLDNSQQQNSVHDFLF